MPSVRFLLMPVVLLLGGMRLSAPIVGTNSLTQPLTLERIATLPAVEQPAWRDYLSRADKQAHQDQDFFRSELRRHGIAETIVPPAGRGTAGIALDRAKSWYASNEARRIAEIIVSFQTPAGGWSKNLDMAQHSRAPGERFALGNVSRFVNATDLDVPHDPDWNYVGTFDNGATTTQMRFLARVIAAGQPEPNELFQNSFAHGLEYVFASQYPNGGWPQVWPLQGGYHDAVTFNDGAMTATLDLLAEVAQGKDAFTFVSPAIRDRAADSLRRGLECVLTAQVIEGGKRTAWCQQYDVLALKPTSARNYEMPALSSGESAGIMMFLMRLPAPDTNVVAAVRSASEWFKRTEIRNKEYRKTSSGKRLVDAPGSGPLWSRYYEVGTNRPIFGDRDKTIHDTVDEISQERREGYSWFTAAPVPALKRFADWNQDRR